MPDDHLPLAAIVAEHRRAVPRFFRRQRPPSLFAGIFVKSQRSRAFAGSQTNQFVSDQYRMPGPTPHRRFGLIFFFEIVRPFYFPIIRVQAKQIPLGAETIDPPFAYQRGDTRAGRIAHRVGTIIFVFPNLFAVGGIETEHTLSAVDDAALEGIGRIAGTGASWRSVRYTRPLATVGPE